MWDLFLQVLTSLQCPHFRREVITSLDEQKIKFHSHTFILSYTQSTRQQNLQKIIYDYKEVMHLWTKKCLIFKTEVELTLSHPCLKPSTCDNKLTITQVQSILYFLFIFFQVYYSTRIDSMGTVFSHTKVLFVFSSLWNSFVTDRSEVGKGWEGINSLQYGQAEKAYPNKPLESYSLGWKYFKVYNGVHNTKIKKNVWFQASTAK
jgi:hypothetical protein